MRRFPIDVEMLIWQYVHQLMMQKTFLLIDCGKAGFPRVHVSYVYLSKAERQRMASVPHQLWIEQFQNFDFKFS